MSKLNWDRARDRGTEVEPMPLHGGSAYAREMIDWLLADPSAKSRTFVASLESDLRTRGRLTERQMFALRKIYRQAKQPRE